MTDMLPISAFAVAKLRKLGIGRLFTPFSHPAAKFLAGSVEGTGVLLLLEDGPDKFEAAQPKDWEWPEAGYCYRDIRFEAHPGSIVGYDEMTFKKGSLVVGEAGTFILAMSQQIPHVVRVDDQGSGLPSRGDATFARWRIVCGPEDRPTELFEQGGYDLANV